MRVLGDILTPSLFNESEFIAKEELKRRDRHKRNWTTLPGSLIHLVGRLQRKLKDYLAIVFQKHRREIEILLYCAALVGGWCATAKATH